MMRQQPCASFQKWNVLVAFFLRRLGKFTMIFSLRLDCRSEFMVRLLAQLLKSTLILSACFGWATAWGITLTEELIRRSNRIGIFIGTFDPIHEGHVGLAEAAAREGNLDLVILLPAKNPSKMPTSLTQRMAIVSRTVGNHPLIAFLDETGSPDLAGAFTAARTGRGFFNRLRELNPRVQLSVIVGTDNAESDLVSLYKRLRISPDRWLIGGRESGSRQGNVSRMIPRDRIQILNSVPSGFSSTRIRSELAANPDRFFRPVASGAPQLGLHPEAYRYIIENGVYLGSEPNTQVGYVRRARRLMFDEVARPFLFETGLLEAARALSLQWRTGAGERSWPTEVRVGERVLPVRRYLGAGMTSSAFIVEWQGRQFAVKVSHREGVSYRRDALIHRWVATQTQIPVPELIESDPEGHWTISEVIEGPTLMDWIQQNRRMNPNLDARLRNLISEARLLYRRSGIALDLRSDNIRIRDGIPYLVDLGPLTNASNLPRDVPSAWAQWRREARQLGVATLDFCSKYFRATLEGVRAMRH